MAPTGSLVKFNQFTQIPMGFYKVIGIEPYQESESRARSRILTIIFYFGMTNMNGTVLGGLIYTYLSFGKISSFLDITGLLACIGFCFVADFKMLAVWMNRGTLSSSIKSLKEMFPKTIELQEEYEIEKYLKKIRRLMIFFSVTYMVQLSIFSLLPLVKSVVVYLFLSEEFIRQLPYLIWYPFNEYSPAIFPIAYASQDYTGFVAASAIVSSDLLLWSVIIQLSMHFDYLTNLFMKLKPNGTEQDQRRLEWMVERHVLVLKLCDDVNKIFGISILCNFFTSSVIICLLGLQLTMGTDVTNFVEYCMYMTTSLIQVFLICYLGNTLMVSSVNVANATYNHDWQQANLSYKRNLIPIIQRSQKPAQLRAATFPPISLETFSSVVKLSYQFFAVLRQMYGK